LAHVMLSAAHAGQLMIDFGINFFTVEIHRLAEM